VRLRVDVAASAPQMDWRDVHGPARAVVYELIKTRDPGLAAELHDSGWQGTGLRPVGISPPMFTGAAAKRGVYTTSGHGSVWLGTPVPQIAAALLSAAAGCGEIRWGAVTLTIKGVQLESAPDHRSGQAVFASVSPVLVRHENRFLLPGDAMFTDRLVHNVRHKAGVLGLPDEAEVEVLDAGQRRRFDVAGALRIGAPIRARVAAAPAVLDAVYDQGLGVYTIQGFGWLR
jgi:CRISPR-associated endoribonuclease Cas6